MKRGHPNRTTPMDAPSQADARSSTTVNANRAPEIATLWSAEAPPTLEVAAYQAIRRLLTTGAFQPGQRIPIRVLSAASGQGTMPTGMAVRQLAAERALEYEPNKGARIPLLTRVEFDDLFQVAFALERMIIERAARKCTLADVGRFKEIVARYKAAADAANEGAVLEANADFWFALYELSGSTVLKDYASNVWVRLGPLVAAPYRHTLRDRHDSAWEKRSKAFFDSRLRLIRTLVSAVSKGDADAACNSAEDINQSLRTWLLASISLL